LIQRNLLSLHLNSLDTLIFVITCQIVLLAYYRKTLRNLKTMKITNSISVTGAGDSHGSGYTGIIEGLPSGLEISVEEIQAELNRRKPGNNYASSRKEEDLIEITSGYYLGKTTGAP